MSICVFVQIQLYCNHDATVLIVKWLFLSYRWKGESSDSNFEIGKPYQHFNWMLQSSGQKWRIVCWTALLRKQEGRSNCHWPLTSNDTHSVVYGYKFLRYSSLSPWLQSSLQSLRNSRKLQIVWIHTVFHFLYSCFCVSCFCVLCFCVSVFCVSVASS